MSKSVSPIRIGIFGPNGAQEHERHGCGLWPAGYVACVEAAGGEPVALGENIGSRSWDQLLDDVQGVLLTGGETPPRFNAQAERLCQWCRKRRFPLLGIDAGLHILNLTHGGTIYQSLAREFPEALQHRHPPERGLRHAINVIPGTRLADMYGEGEVVVNSEHRRGVQRVARGFRISAQALDGVVEAIESESDDWFAVGVQWHPASATASGLDIQIFRGLVDACREPVAALSAA
jgi:putative glutamine amidotransferase